MGQKMAFFLIWQAIAMLITSLGFAAPPIPREMPDPIKKIVDFASKIPKFVQLLVQIFLKTIPY